jgi:predicted amidohydrolase YtcJ
LRNRQFGDGADQAIKVEEALKAITIHAARQIGLEDTIGSLEQGKEADLTIIEADPFKTDPDKISAIKVSETWVAGQKAFG